MSDSNAVPLACPGCSGPMEELDAGPCRVDRCTTCRGIWFDRDELYRLSRESPEALAALDAPSPLAALTDTHGNRDCPRCRRALYPGKLTWESELTVDRCHACGGLWLDAGEARASLRHRDELAPAPERRPSPEPPSSPAPIHFSRRDGDGEARFGVIDVVDFGLGAILDRVFDW